MAEIKSKDQARFLNRPDPNARLMLLAGRDRGRVKEASQRLQSLWFGGEGAASTRGGEGAGGSESTASTRGGHAGGVETFQASEWKTAPMRVVEAALSPTLLGGNRVVRVTDGDKGLVKALEVWLERASLASDTLVIVEGGELAKTDALRKLCIKAPNAAELFFYPDEARDITALVKEVLTISHGMTVSADAMQLLQQNLGGDRAISRGELEKLALYADGRSCIEAEDVAAVVSEAGALAFDTLVHAVALGDFRALDREFFRLLEAGENVNTLLSVVSNHFAKLNALRVLMDSGQSFQAASGQMRPPLFWKSKPKIEAALSRWPGPALETARRRLLDTVVDVRTSGRPEIETAQRGLFALAFMAAK